MVEHDGSRGVPRCASAFDNSRQWRQQRVASAAVETGVAEKLADETGLEISVCHFPPGTSKWNRIEHRLFSFITKNWRGKPLVSHEVIVNLIAATTTRNGLRVQSQLDTGKYPKGIKVGKQEFAAIQLRPDTFHGEWNYTIAPRP